MLLVTILSTQSLALYENKDGSEFLIVQLNPGWNLVPTTVYSGISKSSEVRQEDVSIMYMYDVADQLYVPIYPQNNAGDAFQIKSTFNEVISNYYDHSAMWVYSKKSGNLIILRNKETPSYVNMPVMDSWNIYTIMPKMAGKSLNEIAPNCEFAQAGIWDSAKQRWVVFTDEALAGILNDQIAHTSIGNSILLEPKERCVMG